MKVILALSLMMILSACSTAPNRYAASEGPGVGGEVENRTFHSSLSFYQNTKEGCGVIIGQERDSLEAPYKFVVMKDGKKFYDGVGTLGEASRGKYFDHFELHLTKKFFVVLQDEGDEKHFEFYEAKKGLFGTKKFRTLCDEMIPVSEEDFDQQVNW